MEERRLILAFALSFAVLLGFRMWTNSRYPQTAEGQGQALSTATPAPPLAETKTVEPVRTPGPVMAQSTPQPSVPAISGEERRVEIATADAEIAFSSKGARLLSWKLNRYKDPRGKAVEVHPGGNPIPGPLDLVTGRADIDARLRDAPFRVTDLTQGAERGAKFDFSDGSVEASKTIRTIKEGRAFLVEAEVKLNGAPVPAQVFLGPGFGQATEEEKSLQGYIPPQVVAIDDQGSEIRLAPGALAEPRPTRASVLGIENKYFVAVVTREGRASFDATLGVTTHEKESNVHVLVGTPFLLAIDAKDHDRLQSLDLGLERVVPVGSWIGPIVVPLTRALRAVNARVGNYGVAIVLLTIAISLALAPLRHYAILSSAKMAKVGPQIRAVQERYKRLSLTDPKRQQMQQEIADVYAKNGIDMVKQTAAGCLPTLLTMPFLFAFYRMLDISVDLKGAPFLWIPDLSLKDPLFITPLLSGLSMIAMQKLMPAPAMDPAQQRMMLLMPIIFSGMFAWAPAGLNLYWFISNVAAMVQQGLAMYFWPDQFPKSKPAA